MKLTAHPSDTEILNRIIADDDLEELHRCSDGTWKFHAYKDNEWFVGEGATPRDAMVDAYRQADEATP